MATYFYEGNAIDAEILEKAGCDEMSPALIYAGASDMCAILNDIKRGAIPCNTGEPFPVVWRNDNKNTEPFTPDKPNFAGTPVGFINPVEDLLKL